MTEKEFGAYSLSQIKSAYATLHQANLDSDELDALAEGIEKPSNHIEPWADLYELSFDTLLSVFFGFRIGECPRSLPKQILKKYSLNF